ncbi:hypothetical protein IMG5_199910 [Ichthyophthirius multifiliis]|uniref:protein-tyrosine-phosphatase n=1 Tax=Ichthyophthirius multifiliis TaxID=5932 RepID=G0R5N2_ICHMU|nr:hypothetical protein IMG5_199910 [Ichthyophthirius multifiliis]EGR27205.1 hypothetical protein IMG5_199910 [Ichthyophthirius multifiliis]|eukprot:XP_004024089.1 hypothetical protein IMG5_199910 [Ichthyophthirius multifiliis]
MIQKGQQVKNSLIIYDITNGECIKQEVTNVIKIDNELGKQIIAHSEIIKLENIQKKLPKNKQDLFSRNKRCYNFIVFQDKNTQFLQILNDLIQKQYIMDSQIKGSELLNSGYIKISDKILQLQLENKLLEEKLNVNSDQSIFNLRKALALYNVLKKFKINQVHILRQPTQLFTQLYPFMTNFFQILNNVQLKFYPNEILNGQFYYGNCQHAAQEELISQLGITHVVNMTTEVENFFESNTKVTYLKISILDEDDVKIFPYFKQTYQFIRNALENPKNKIFVHCAQGKSRSGTIVIMYLMKKYKWSLNAVIKNNFKINNLFYFKDIKICIRKKRYMLTQPRLYGIIEYV